MNPRIFPLKCRLSLLNAMHLGLSAVLVGCFLETSIAPEKRSSDLEGKAYQEVMSLNDPEVLGKYTLHGGDSAAVANTVFCGPVGEFGDVDRYNFKMLNAQLEMTPSLGKILELDEITDCAGANKYMEMKYALIESRPSPEMLGDTSYNELGAGVSEDEYVSAVGKTAIRNGIAENSLGKVMLGPLLATSFVQDQLLAHGPFSLRHTAWMTSLSLMVPR